MGNYPTSELMQWRFDRQEDVYASTKREPLGRGGCVDSDDSLFAFDPITA